MRESTLSEIWRGRGLLRDLVRADLARRFSGSALGTGWVFLQPLLLLGLLTVVFGTVLPVEVAGGRYGSYALFLCAGFLPWAALEEVARTGCGSFTGNAHLIHHTSHSRALFAVAPVLVSTLILAFSLAVVVALAAALGVRPGPATASLLPLLLLQTALGIGIALAAATLQTYSRDTLPVVQSVLPVLFWASPIVYPVDVLPEAIRPLAAWNPLAHVLACYRAPLLEATAPPASGLLVFALVAVAALGIGGGVYARGRATVADRV